MKQGYRTGIIMALILTPTALMAADQETTTREERETKALESMFPEGAPSEKDVYRTDQLLISATGSLKPVHLAPSVATVITAEDIERIGAITLDQVLETVPGLHVEPNGTAFFSSTWSMRGIHTIINPHVLLLINSQPYQSSYTGSRPSKYQMPVSMISRVEVVRGPGSALYGADAFSGVINVITKDNHEIGGTEMGGRAGSFDSYGTWIQHGGSYDGWDVALGIEWQKSQGDKNRIIGSDYVSSIAPAASLTPGALPDWRETIDSNLTVRHGKWEGHLYSNLQKSDTGLGSLQALTEGSELDNKELLADLGYTTKEWLPNWELSAKGFYSYKKSDSYMQQLPASFRNMIGNPIYEQQDGGLDLGGLWTGLTDNAFRIGLGWKNYAFDPDQYKNFGPAAGANQFGPLVHTDDPAYIFITPANRRLFYGLVQDEWSFAKSWQLTAGLRYDDYSDFGSTVNPRVALVWETRPELTTKLMYGEAFRAPSFGEQWIKNNPQAIGNPNLDPEEIKTYELAFDYQPLRDLRFGLNFFYYEANNMIELTGPLPQIYTNIGEQEGRGMELEMDWKMKKSFEFKANCAYQRAKLTATDALVPEAPGLQFYLNPHWEFAPEWSLDGQYFWIGDRSRAEGDPREEISDTNLVNLTLRKKKIIKQLDAALAIRNVLDEDGRIPSPYAPGVPAGAYVAADYPTEGRSFWIELRYHF
jgi:iron complex outermembrane receptor protein